jgi:hypothetical protein
MQGYPYAQAPGRDYACRFGGKVGMHSVLHKVQGEFSVSLSGRFILLGKRDRGVTYIECTVALVAAMITAGEPDPGASCESSPVRLAALLLEVSWHFLSVMLCYVPDSLTLTARLSDVYAFGGYTGCVVFVCNCRR